MSLPRSCCCRSSGHGFDGDASDRAHHPCLKPMFLQERDFAHLTDLRSTVTPRRILRMSLTIRAPDPMKVLPKVMGDVGFPMIALYHRATLGVDEAHR